MVHVIVRAGHVPTERCFDQVLFRSGVVLIMCCVDETSLGEMLYHVITRINHECCQSETCAERGQGTQRDHISSSTCSKTSSFPQQEELVQWEEQGLS